MHKLFFYKYLIYKLSGIETQDVIFKVLQTNNKKNLKNSENKLMFKHFIST